MKISQVIHAETLLCIFISRPIAHNFSETNMLRDFIKKIMTYLHTNSKDSEFSLSMHCHKTKVKQKR